MTELQIDRDALFMLTQDDLAAFLSDTSDTSDTSAFVAMDIDDWPLEHLLLEVRQGSCSPLKTTPTTRKRTSRIRERQQLQLARAEIASLHQQPKIVHENHKLRVSLDQMLNRSSGGSYNRSKFRALRERNLREEAEDQGNRLRERVAANTGFLEQVSSLVFKQRDFVPK